MLLATKHQGSPSSEASSAVQGAVSPLTSEEVAEKLKISYPTLMRLLRAGLVSPAGYSGNRRTPVFWTPYDVERARLAHKLRDLGLEDKWTKQVLDNYWEVFERGFEPTWIVNRYDSEGNVVGRALSLHHPGREREGKTIMEFENGASVSVAPGYFLTFETFPPRPRPGPKKGRKGGKRS
ncbi:MAG: MerR family transcriptional regulator [Bdellovibrionota bacterium]